MTVTLAIDCMGGDHGPSVTVPAALDFLRADRDARVVLVGRPEAIEPHLGTALATFGERLRIQRASEVVAMDEPPALAMRNKKDSSMRVAVNLVKEGEAQAAVSAGNTGALMAISRFVLKTLPGIDRPAICSTLPSMRGQTHMLDLGANVDCSPEHLLQFAVMGSALVYYVMLPFVLWFSLSQQIVGDGVKVVLQTRVSEYLTLVTTLLLAFGLSFQLPVVLSLGGLAGLVTSDMLRTGRRYAIVAVFVVAAIVTPPDPISQITLAVPLCLLYEISIWCVWLIERRRKREDDEEAGKDIVTV